MQNYSTIKIDAWDICWAVSTTPGKSQDSDQKTTHLYTWTIIIAEYTSISAREYQIYNSNDFHK